jgi:hypothetical protein
MITMARFGSQRLNCPLPGNKRGIEEPRAAPAPSFFFAPKYAGFVTGEIFNVNGGAVLVG